MWKAQVTPVFLLERFNLLSTDPNFTQKKNVRSSSASISLHQTEGTFHCIARYFVDQKAAAQASPVTIVPCSSLQATRVFYLSRNTHLQII